mgnify:CR=1 FL=1
MKEIVLETVSAPGCTHCAAFEEFWHSVEKGWGNVKYINRDITTPEGQELAQKHMIFASPGIIINGELHATGGFDKDTFLAALKKASE